MGFSIAILTNVIVFATAILYVILLFTVVYLLCGQSKLKMLVAIIALHHVKSIEAALNSHETCELGIIKILAILNLAAVILVLFIKIRRSKLFQGHLFKNMTKINLFIADNQSYVSLELNRIARNIHLFKLTGDLNIDNFNLKKNWIWDVLEVNWHNVQVTLNDKSINVTKNSNNTP